MLDSPENPEMRCGLGRPWPLAIGCRVISSFPSSPLYPYNDVLYFTSSISYSYLCTYLCTTFPFGMWCRHVEKAGLRRCHIFTCVRTCVYVSVARFSGVVPLLLLLLLLLLLFCTAADAAALRERF